MTTRGTRRHPWILPVLLCAAGLTGCSSFDIGGVNPRRLPRELLGEPRAELEMIDLSLLRQDRPEEYRLDARDVLGIYIPNILGSADEAPPVNIPEQGDLPPSIGFPFPVREDGTVSVPLLDEAIKVQGMTVPEAEKVIRRAYVEKGILPEQRAEVIVTLNRKRTYQVLVIREDGGLERSSEDPRNTQRGTGTKLELIANENDVLHALTETGGLPGLDAKSEVIILRGKFDDSLKRAQFIARLESNLDPCEPLPIRPANPDVVRIPLRLPPGQAPGFSQNDIILRTGDIVYITARDADVFYTGGILRGDVHQLPRDYDLDILGAIAVAGGAVGGGGLQFGAGAGQAGAGGIGRGSLQQGVLPPTRAVIVRKTPPYGEISIKIDLTKALYDPSERVMIQPGDIVILAYKPSEAIGNLFFSTFNFTRAFDNMFFR